jgi:hypothetical protein
MAKRARKFGSQIQIGKQIVSFEIIFVNYIDSVIHAADLL